MLGFNGIKRFVQYLFSFNSNLIKAKMTRQNFAKIMYIKFLTILLGSIRIIKSGQTDGAENYYKYYVFV